MSPPPKKQTEQKTMKTTEKNLRAAHDRHDYWQRRRGNAYTERELNHSREMEKRALLHLYKIMNDFKKTEPIKN